MAHQLEARIRQQMMHVASRPRIEVIDAQNLIAVFQQAIAKLRSNKSGSAGDEGTTFGQHKHPPGVAGGESIIRVSLVPIYDWPVGMRRGLLFGRPTGPR